MSSVPPYFLHLTTENERVCGEQVDCRIPTSAQPILLAYFGPVHLTTSQQHVMAP